MPWMSSHFFQQREPSYVSWPCNQNASELIHKANPGSYTHKEVAKKLTKDPVVWLHLWPYLVPSWCRVNTKIWDCWKLWGIWVPQRLLILWTSPEKKTEVKMNEEMHKMIFWCSALKRCWNFMWTTLNSMKNSASNN